MPQTRSQRFLLGVSRSSSALVVAIGCLVLLGWFFHFTVLTRGASSWPAVNPLTAILFVIGGFGVWRLAGKERSQDGWNWISFLLGLVVTAGGALKLAEFSLELDLEPVRFLGGSVLDDEIAPNTTLNFLLCGLGLAFLDVQTRRGFRPAQLCFLLAGLVTLLALVGYAYRVFPLYRFGSDVPMAPIAAVAFAFFSLSGLCARPDRGVMEAVTSDTTAGATARRLLPAAFLIPLVLGALRFTSERRGYLGVEFGVSLFVVANIVLFALLIWWHSRLLYGAEQERQRIERRLAVQYGATRILAGSSDLNQATREIVRSICKELGWQAGDVWRVDPGAKLIRCEDVYVAGPELEEFADCTRKLSYSKGTGLPGEVWEKREAFWIEDAGNESQLARALTLKRAGVRSVVGFPVRYNGTVCGVMEFFSTRVEPRDEMLLQTLNAVGSQLGQFAERMVADEQLRRLTADLARSNTDLQQFAYVASHDLSEPLRMIVSYLQLLQERHRAQLNEEAQEFIGFAVDGAQRMQTMIHDLLTYARVDSRGGQFQAVDCEVVLAGAIQNLKVTLEESGVTIEHEPLPTVHGDSTQLMQVFQNLIGNAIKFRSKVDPRIHVSAKRRDGEWEFSVRDNGIGIDPHHFERIFVLFQRLHTRQEYPGTGIGLAICKKIIDRHGGRIWVESQQGKGTTFFFTLRAAPG